MELYDGSTDPQEHMDAFKSRMALAGVSDPIRCRAFPITLKKAALKWFNSLPPRLINRFSDLVSIFFAHFTTKRFKPKQVSGLLGLHQRQNESLRDFLKRYNAETLLVNNVQTQAAILTLLNGLRPWPFKTSLSKRPLELPEEIQTRAEKYIFLEEIEEAIANSGRHQSERKAGGQDEHPRKDMHSRAGKYHEYTPLTYPYSSYSEKSVKSRGSPSQKFLK